MQVQLILILIFAIIVAAFAIQNTMAVVIRFLFWEANLSLVLVILGSIALGALFIYLVDLVRQIKVKREIKEFNRQIAELTKEKETLQGALAAYESVTDDKTDDKQEASQISAQAHQAETPDAAPHETPDAPKFDTETGEPLDPEKITTLEELDRMIGSGNDGP